MKLTFGDEYFYINIDAEDDLSPDDLAAYVEGHMATYGVYDATAAEKELKEAYPNVKFTSI